MAAADGTTRGASQSLARFLLVRILLLVLPLVISGMAVHSHFQRRLLESQFDESLVEKAMTLATLVAREEDRLELQFADEFMPQYSRADQPFYFQMWYPDGRDLERSYSLSGQDLPFRHGPVDAPVAFETRLPSGAELRCVGVEFPTRLGPHPLAGSPPSVVIVLAADAAQLHEKLVLGLREVAITGVVSVVSIAVVVALALRRGSHLLRRAVHEADELQAGALVRDSDVEQVPEEIRPIVAALQRSLQAIRRHIDRERRFTADVAHELRTPIAELRVAADIAQRWGDDDSLRRLVRDAQAIALQMGSLVESLLQLATLESDAPMGQVERADLCGLVERIAEQCARCREDGDRIGLDLPRSLELSTRPQLWEVALRNLLDNALSHSPPGAHVQVVLRSRGDGAYLCVSNRADQLDSEDVQHCTERLWRGRREPNDPQHFGLGLSIVQAAGAKLGHSLSVRLDQGVFHASLERADVNPVSSP